MGFKSRDCKFQVKSMILHVLYHWINVTGRSNHGSVATYLKSFWSEWCCVFYKFSRAYERKIVPHLPPIYLFNTKSVSILTKYFVGMETDGVGDPNLLIFYKSGKRSGLSKHLPHMYMGQNRLAFSSWQVARSACFKSFIYYPNIMYCDFQV